MKFYHFPNIGFLEEELSKESIKKLNKYIKDSYKKVNYDLAGNITKSNELIDKDNWFFNNELSKFINAYIKTFGDEVIPNVLSKNCHYYLHKFWVNFQKKYEFNPMHNHSGIFSFVIWIKIPASYKEEKKLSFVKECNNPSPNTFSFLFTNSLGKIAHYNYNLEPSDEGKILFFPSSLSHMVYPYYTSNKERISISGNIHFDIERLYQ